MYERYVEPLGQLLHTHAQNGAESANFEIYLTGKETLGEKKDLLLRSGLEPGSDALQTTAFATEPMGLWQLWTANLLLLGRA